MKLKNIAESVSFEQSKKILRESALVDIRRIEDDRLFEARVAIQSKKINEEEIDEAFFDTVKNLGKNAVGAVKNAWQKAKDQGNQDEMKRLEKKMAALKSKMGKGGEEKKDGGEAAPRAGGGGGKSGADAGQQGNADEKKPDEKKDGEGKGSEASIKAAEEAIVKLLDALKKVSPEAHAKVLASLGKSPEAITKIEDSPKVQQAEKEVTAKISKADGEGLAAKVDNFTKTANPNAVNIITAIVAVKDATGIPPEAVSKIAVKSDPTVAKQPEKAAEEPPKMEELPEEVKKAINILTPEEKQALLKQIEA